MSVHVIITKKITGEAHVCPYSQTRHLQFYMINGTVTDQPVLYRIPVFEVRIDGGSDYDAVRFGLQNHALLPPSKVRACDAGISHHHSCTPSWNPTYCPHSFDRMNRMGAWRLFPGKTFYIHEGPNRNRDGYGGSLGCVEILDGYWNDFLQEIERIGKAPCDQIAKNHGLKVTIEAAPFPVAKLVE
jgi:hypothetical protein